MSATKKYDELAARAERGELSIKAGTLRRGPAARDETHRALMEATGATTTAEAKRIAVGRPPAGTKPGPSPVIRARVPQALKDGVEALAQREHRDESDIVREAVAAYLGARRVS